MNTATRAVLARALAQLPEELRQAPASCRSLRHAITASWPDTVPRPPRRELVAAIHGIRRADATASITGASLPGGRK